MYKIENGTMRYGIDEYGRAASCYHKRTCHEYQYSPGNLWKLIYSEGERQEIPVISDGQVFSVIVNSEKTSMDVIYPSLKGEGVDLDVGLVLHFCMVEEGLAVTAEIDNRGDTKVQEIQITAVSGVRSLSGNPGKDGIAWPMDLGRKVGNPAYSDLSVYAGFRKYERHDQYHTDMDGLYPGRLSMQWFDWYNEGEGLYVGVHNASHQTICLHIERDVKLNLLRMGGIFYPMMEPGERYTSEPVVYAPHVGDWHAGAAIYRHWIESTGWRAPRQPEWVKMFKGWLRVILKQHHGELNWDYGDIPALYDEAASAGMDTLFLLGWEKGGFARMWPDYVLDERMGGREKLEEGIRYVHSRGGRVVMFLSYLLIDRQSEFYRSGKGEEATIKSYWGTEVPFSETYCGEGTYRKLGNPPMPMYFACPSSQVWQDRMLEACKYCLDLGADGVLFDLGGHPAYFCYDKRHGHKKPSQAFANKDLKYKELHEYIRSRGDEKITMMEDNVDIFAQHMDISQGTTTRPKPEFLLEMYRYTFPECIMTNRECGEDEDNYKTYANHSFIYGLRFDMTIHRCCGSLSDIPNYAAYLKDINGLRETYGDYLLKGRFVDNEGFCCSSREGTVIAKGYLAADGRLAVAYWNTAEHETEAEVTGNGASHRILVGANQIGVLEL